MSKTNISKENLLLAVLILAAVSVSCGLLKGGSSNASYGVADVTKSKLTPVDPTAPFPAMTADAIDELIAEKPELAKYRDMILEAERSAIAGLLSDIRQKSEVSTIDPKLSHAEFFLMARSESSVSYEINFLPVAYAADPPAVPKMGGAEFALIGHQIAFLKEEAGGGGSDSRNQSKSVTMKDERTGAVTATMTTDAAGALELTTTVNMPQFGLNANSKVRLTGNQCPDADGKVNFTIEHGSNGRAGSSGSMIFDKTFTAKLTATVNDDAEIANFDLDLKQSTRSTAGERQVYVETSQTVRSTDGTYRGMQFNDARVDRSSSQATPEDAEVSRASLNGALYMAVAVLENAKARWQGGGCVQIVAASPGKVDVSSTTQIPVKVVHKIDGSDVPSKLAATLSGGASVDPALLPRTAGTLTYVAPAEPGTSSTISLTANSRRGRATLDLTATTGGNSYRVNGKSQGASFNGEICSLGKPFVLNVDSITGSWPMEFTPSDASGLSGQMKATFSSNGCTLSGGGPYSVVLNDGGSGKITFTFNSTATCPFGKRTTSKTSELELKPAPDLKCN